jgi:hypothetical protein
MQEKTARHPEALGQSELAPSGNRGFATEGTLYGEN